MLPCIRRSQGSLKTNAAQTHAQNDFQAAYSPQKESYAQLPFFRHPSAQPHCRQLFYRQLDGAAPCENADDHAQRRYQQRRVSQPERGHVAENRAYVQTQVPVPIAYLQQTHSTIVVQAADSIAAPLNADASVDASGKVACAVMTADCLPVLFCDRAGTVVAAAHAGWRGLADGVLQNTVAAMGVPTMEIMAYFAPAIGAESFEVGQDVFDAFCTGNHAAERMFAPIGGGKYLADIYGLARLILQREGVTQIFGGEHCTVLERETFFSYRRDGATGRMASIIWLENEA